MDRSNGAASTVTDLDDDVAVASAIRGNLDASHSNPVHQTHYLSPSGGAPVFQQQKQTSPSIVPAAQLQSFANSLTAQPASQPAVAQQVESHRPPPVQNVADNREAAVTYHDRMMASDRTFAPPSPVKIHTTNTTGALLHIERKKLASSHADRNRQSNVYTGEIMGQSPARQRMPDHFMETVVQERPRTPKDPQRELTTKVNLSPPPPASAQVRSGVPLHRSDVDPRLPVIDRSMFEAQRQEAIRREEASQAKAYPISGRHKTHVPTTDHIAAQSLFVDPQPSVLNRAQLNHFNDANNTLDPGPHHVQFVQDQTVQHETPEQPSHTTQVQTPPAQAAPVPTAPPARSEPVVEPVLSRRDMQKFVPGVTPPPLSPSTAERQRFSAVGKRGSSDHHQRTTASHWSIGTSRDFVGKSMAKEQFTAHSGSARLPKARDLHNAPSQVKIEFDNQRRLQTATQLSNAVVAETAAASPTPSRAQAREYLLQADVARTRDSRRFLHSNVSIKEDPSLPFGKTHTQETFSPRVAAPPKPNNHDDNFWRSTYNHLSEGSTNPSTHYVTSSQSALPNYWG